MQQQKYVPSLQNTKYWELNWWQKNYISSPRYQILQPYILCKYKNWKHCAYRNINRTFRYHKVHLSVSLNFLDSSNGLAGCEHSLLSRLHVKVGHHFPEVGQRVVVRVQVYVGKVPFRVRLREAGVVTTEGEGAGQQFRHHRVVRY